MLLSQYKFWILQYHSNCPSDHSVGHRYGSKQHCYRGHREPEDSHSGDHECPGFGDFLTQVSWNLIQTIHVPLRIIIMPTVIRLNIWMYIERSYAYMIHGYCWKSASVKMYLTETSENHNSERNEGSTPPLHKTKERIQSFPFSVTDSSQRPEEAAIPLWPKYIQIELHSPLCARYPMLSSCQHTDNNNLLGWSVSFRWFLLKQTVFREVVWWREQAGGWTYTDTSSVHAHGQPPGLWVKGHTGARRWRHKKE